MTDIEAKARGEVARILGSDPIALGRFTQATEDALVALVTTARAEAVSEERAATVAWLRAFGDGMATAKGGSEYDFQRINAAGDLIKILADSVEMNAQHTHARPRPRPSARWAREGKGEQEG